MKNWHRYAIAGLIASFTAVSVRADDDSTNGPSLYRAHEFSADFFGSVSIGQQTINNISGNKVVDSGQLGAGVGLNYFITRYLGIGGDAYSENTTGGFIDNASGNLIGRLPIGKTGLAPYIYGGGGYQFEIEDSFAQAGAGIELRFTHHIGIFVDARYVFTEHNDNFGLGRFGLRFSF